MIPSCILTLVIFGLDLYLELYMYGRWLSPCIFIECAVVYDGEGFSGFDVMGDCGRAD